MSLSSPITSLSPIAGTLRHTLSKLGITTVFDLLNHFPIRYQDLSQTKTIQELNLGSNGVQTIRATLDSIEQIRTHTYGKVLTKARVHDTTGSVAITWFQVRFLARTLKPGDHLLLTGKFTLGKTGIECIHPEYERITGTTQQIHSGRIVPYYSLTKGLSHKQMRFLISKALAHLSGMVEYIPRELLTKLNLDHIRIAYKNIHFPEHDAGRIRAEERLKFNEIFLLQLRAARERHALGTFSAPKIPFFKHQTQAYTKTLPFSLTTAQRKAAWEIIQDIGTTRPMNRLLEGDVGSGKTVVASLPMLNALVAGFQCAYMAPTEILAEQQYKSFSTLFTNVPFSIALLTGSNAKREHHEPSGISLQKRKKDLIEHIAQGTIHLVIGTHALIQDTIQFHNLGLVIIDEQHRFGVEQRKKLRTNLPAHTQTLPHLLSMTATPIPRSLALTAYGDLDLSILDEMPKNRKPISTNYVLPEKRSDVYQHIDREITQGRQAFVVCPIIDPSDHLGAASAASEMKKLQHTVFPNRRIAMLHGRMRASQKNTIMHDFKAHKFDILVATPVIEVGIDIPNATIIVIESAERFGLAQLHQIRGRVGRGDHQSHCYLFSDSDSSETRERMHAFIHSKNGFELAERDLAFRGPGAAYGVRQSGFDDVLYLARLTDYPIIKKAQAAVRSIEHIDPSLTKYPELKKRVEELDLKIHPE